MSARVETFGLLRAAGMPGEKSTPRSTIARDTNDTLPSEPALDGTTQFREVMSQQSSLNDGYDSSKDESDGSPENSASDTNAIDSRPASPTSVHSPSHYTNGRSDSSRLSSGPPMQMGHPLFGRSSWTNPVAAGYLTPPTSFTQVPAQPREAGDETQPETQAANASRRAERTGSSLALVAAEKGSSVGFSYSTNGDSDPTSPNAPDDTQRASNDANGDTRTESPAANASPAPAPASDLPKFSSIHAPMPEVAETADSGTVTAAALLPKDVESENNRSATASRAPSRRTADQPAAPSAQSSTTDSTIASDLIPTAPAPPAADPNGLKNDTTRDQANARHAGDSTQETTESDSGASSPVSPAPIAFEATLSSTQAAPESAQGAASHSAPAIQSGSKQSFTTDEPQSEAAGFPVQTEAVLKASVIPPAATQTYTPQAGQPQISRNASGQTEAPIAEQMQPMIEPATVPSSRHSISVNVPGVGDDAPVNLRFVERGGDVHLTVRTWDADMAQNLRSGLGELSDRLTHSGIHLAPSIAPGADQAPRKENQDSSNDSRRQAPDAQEQDTRRDRRNPRGSDPSPWMQAWNESAGRNNLSKEQNA